MAGAPVGTVIGFTDFRYMRENLFQMYLNHFIKSISPVRPVLLILDSHKSHINYTSIKFCHENGILLYALPPHTTHILQPSKILFAKLKREYNSGYKRLHNSKEEVATKYTFAKILEPTFTTTYTPEAIINAYKVMGIWSFNPDTISFDHFDPLLVIE